MSFPARFNERRKEYDNFQRTNLEYYPHCYEEWMFARTIKDKLEKNASVTEKVSIFAKTSFYKLLVAISGGNKEKAMDLKLTLLSSVIFISFNLQELSKDKMIQGIVATIFFCLRVCTYIETCNNQLIISANKTNFFK